MQRRITGFACAVVIAVIGLGSWSPTAMAATNRTVYVDDTGTANPNKSGKCGRPNYSTIQAAVNDPSASKVVVCKGTYVELVVVDRSLTLEGKSGAVIQAPAGNADAIVTFSGPQHSRLRGFTISGTGSNVAAGVRTRGFVCEDVVCGPTQVSINRNRISDIYSSGDFGNGGTGIFLFKSQANVEDNIVERYGFVGISADGGDRADTSAQIDGNIIRGQGQNGLNSTQIGILLDETTVDVEDNDISGNYGSDINSVGILVKFANGSIRDNTIQQNTTGVRYGPGAGELRSNTIRNNADNGIELVSSSGVTIVENESSNNGGDGIYVATGATGNSIKDNKARSNRGFDINDANGTPLVNTYASNTCITSNPSGLCKN